MTKNPWKLTFKKEPRPTGLYSVGHPNPETIIKHNGKRVGCIMPPAWNTAPGWGILFHVVCEKSSDNPSGWKNIILTQRFETEPLARIAAQESVEKLVKKFELQYSE